jgi:hypothetical protein
MNIENKIKNIITTLPLGLFYGISGISLYLYYRKRDKEASILLKYINEHLQLINGNINVSNGLSGIGLAIIYLSKKGYIKVNINTAMKEIDDLVFKQLAFDKYNKKYNINQLLPIIYYLSVKSKLQERNSEAQYIQRELVKKVINNLYAQIDFHKIDEPLHYSLEYILPQLLYVMGYVASLNFYKSRIESIVRELSPVIFSTIPIMQANRLYLIASLDYLFKEISVDNKGLSYRAMLLANIDVNYILTEEIGCKSIYFENGVASLYFLLKGINDYNQNMTNYRNQIMHIIEESPEWGLLESNSAYLRSHIGLYNGVCGVKMAYEIMKKDKIKEENKNETICY